MRLLYTAKVLKLLLTCNWRNAFGIKVVNIYTSRQKENAVICLRNMLIYCPHNSNTIYEKLYLSLDVTVTIGHVFATNITVSKQVEILRYKSTDSNVIKFWAYEMQSHHAQCQVLAYSQHFVVVAVED